MPSKAEQAFEPVRKLIVRQVASLHDSEYAEFLDLLGAEADCRQMAYDDEHEEDEPTDLYDEMGEAGA